MISRPGFALLSVVAALLSGAPVAQAAPLAQSTGKLYCCTDAGGKQVCGDLMPQECYGRAYRELGESGRTVRNVDAPLTAEQRAERAAEDERRKVEEAVLKEQQRKDQALLNTYGSVRDIDAMRERALGDVEKSISDAEKRIAEIKVQRVKFQNEAEFYKKKQLPPEIQKGLNDTDLEIKAQQSVIESKKKDMEIIREKYDEDKRRYLDISRRGVVSDR
ncbi:MAG: hypothetical protein QM739_08575 [Propionivibrio sp.]